MAPRNRIHVVTLAGARIPRRSHAVIDAFFGMLAH
jgi:hypothetical protein